MKHDHFTARCVLIDGPLALYICQAPATEILEAYRRLGELVEIAARQFNPPTLTSKPPSTPFCANPKDWPSIPEVSCGGDRNVSEFP